MNTIPRITIDYARTLCQDPEAVERGYLDEQLIIDAERLAKDAIQMPTFGSVEFLAGIGQPHQWWEKHLPSYKELANSSAYKKDRKFSVLLMISNYLTRNELLDRVERQLRIGDLSSNDKKTLREWFETNQRTL